MLIFLSALIVKFDKERAVNQTYVKWVLAKCFILILIEFMKPQKGLKIQIIWDLREIGWLERTRRNKINAVEGRDAVFNLAGE